MTPARQPTTETRHPTMKDVAELAQVSQSTVSRILSGAPPTVTISSATRARVIETAERLRYRPNPLARGLRGAPTMLIGAIIRDVTDPFFATAVDALSREARRHGYSVVLGHARGRSEEALALAAVLEARQCDAIVLLGDIGDEPALLEDLAAAGVPVIELWQGSSARGFAAIAVDNRAGLRAALDHLAALGHRRVAFVGNLAKADVQERAAAHAEHPHIAGEVIATENAPQAGAAALDALLDGPEPPTAVAAATDVLAFGILHRAAARGLSVPAELSVTGFDDIPLSATAVPALTTVRMPVVEMAAATIAWAIARPEDRDPALRVYQPELVVRASSGPPRSLRA